MSKAQKKERVNTVITALGLDSCKDTIVGGFFRKGISGGERKRTSVGHELLINPSLLLLDEPTRRAVTLRCLCCAGASTWVTCCVKVQSSCADRAADADSVFQR